MIDCNQCANYTMVIMFLWGPGGEGGRGGEGGEGGSRICELAHFLFDSLLTTKTKL